MLEMISVFLNLSRLDLWPRMWSVLENVPCALEKKVKLIVLGWNVLYISISSNGSVVSFKVCFLDNFLFGWSIHRCEWGIKVSHYYCFTVDFSFCTCYHLPYVLRCSCVGCIYIHNCYIIFLAWSFFVSFHSLYFKVYFFWREYCYSWFLLVSICMKYLFPALQSLCVSWFEVGLL